MNRSGIVFTTLLAGLVWTGTALADEYTPSEDSNRRGIMVGIGLNGGHIAFECTDGSCDESLNEAGGGEIHVAYMLGKKLAISGEVWGMMHNDEVLGVDVSVTHIITTIGPQYWVLPRMWIRGGLGWARAHVEYDAGIIGGDAQSEDVLGVALGLGLEIVSGPNFALDIQLRGGTGFYEDGNTSNAGLGVGLTWF